MTKKNVKGTASFAGALLICQNLGELAAYELAAYQILIPDDDGSPSSFARSLVLMPGVRLAPDEMAQGIAKLGTTALGVRCLIQPAGKRIPAFTVLFAENGKAERFAEMRPWFDRKSGLYLIPDEDTAAGNSTCFQFDRGLRKAGRPRNDEADRHRGVAEATALLLEEGADNRPG
jgi:hypothetical protein